MAILHATSGNIEMLFRPYRIAEDGDPRWLLTQFEFRNAASQLVATTVSVTEHDLQVLDEALADAVAGRRNRITITTMDDDFVLDVTADATHGTASVGFWQGEPAILMRGYRFMVPLKELDAFRLQIEVDRREAATKTSTP